MIKLGVNIDHVATLRQARKEEFPSIVKAAASCEKAGADAITVHLREDRRHIQDKDVYDLRQSLRTKLNLEMAANDEIVEIALKVKPDFVCLVPEKRMELTTEGGLDVLDGQKNLSKTVEKLKKAGIVVSLFIDCNIAQVLASKQINADAIELHTGKYANYFKQNGKDSKEVLDEIKRIKDCAKMACENKLILNAGHGLDFENIGQICKVANFNEFNIGFSIIAQSVFVGLEESVKKMKELINLNVVE